MLDAMHTLGGAINAFLACQPPDADVQAVKQLVTYPIRAWSRTGPFFHHSFTKPRGYPGDFETIEIIYDCVPRGEDLPGLLFDDYYLHARPAQAVRNRLAYLLQVELARHHLDRRRRRHSPGNKHARQPHAERGRHHPSHHDEPMASHQRRRRLGGAVRIPWPADPRFL
jgi:hypothetical protein